MTATAAERPHTAHTARGGGFAGTWTLTRFLLRRDRVRLPAWTAGFALFMGYLTAALPVAYGDDKQLRAIGQMFRDPVGRLMIGPGYGFEDPTLERFVANGYGLYFLVLAALMSILLVSRHTRVEEQNGRAELVRANVVGRYAALTATLVVAAVTNAAAGAAVFAMMAAVGGYGAGGSLVFAAGIAATGLAFAGVAAVTVQVTEYSRAASGMAGAVLGAAFVVRSGGDMAEQGGSPLSWFSPLAWGQQTAPFVLDRWWPLLLPLAVAAGGFAAGYALLTRRDLGSGLLAVRAGRSRAAASLGTPLGLALRLERAGIIGWAAALAIGSLAFGAYAQTLLDAAEDMPAAFVRLFGGADGMLAGYLAYMAGFMSYIVGAYAILAVQGLRTEETGGRGEPVLATPVGRWAWLGSNLAVTAAAVVVLMAAAGAAIGAGAALVTGDTRHIGDLTLAHLNHVPAVLVVLGLAALLFGAAPRAIPAAWAVVGYGAVIGTFGPLMDLPDAALDASPFHHPARMPVESFDPGPFAALLALAAVLAALGFAAFRRRGINV
ncbi:exporter of polyketide antibiotics [Streptomonospora halophila]|uniref:Exporter of polyketide antibiotics n=1 Tax=Streptomonospora halophila TaxID=427369 RepID=A0ABP9GRA5_9ACTN